MKLGAALAVGVLTISSVAQAQTVDEIIAKNLKAKGGVEVLKATHSVKLTGKVAAQGMEIPMTVWAKRPNLFRQETSVGGQSMVNAFDGKVMWIMAPGAPPRELPDMPAAAKQETEFDSLFIDYKEKGIAIELVGRERIAGKDTHHLKVTMKDGGVQHHYLDADTGLEKKISMTVDQNGKRITLERETSDYRQAEGRMMPFRTRQIVDGTPVMEMTLDKVEINVPIEDSLFKMPAKPAK
jgi:outer membrane lipoprotein-sorting protein